MQETALLGFVLQTIRVASISHIMSNRQNRGSQSPWASDTLYSVAQHALDQGTSTPKPQHGYWGLPDTRQFLAYLSCKRADEIVVEEAIPLPDFLATWGAPWNPLCGKYWMFVHYIWYCHHHPLEGWKAIILMDSGNTHDKGQDQWISTIGPSSF